MIRSMETIYDVLRFVVSKLRASATDLEIQQALNVIAAAEGANAGTGQSQSPADPGLPQQGGF
jgi:hypothetical protein